MADPTEAKEHYEQLCLDNSLNPNPYIVRQLDFGIVKTNSGYLLNLAGNNHLLTSSRLEDSDLVQLVATLHESVCVTEVDLRYNNITDVGAQLIANLIKESVTLQAVNLMCNSIGPEGADLIANSLHDNQILRMLKMNGNKIQNKGGMSFAGMLQINTALEVLDLNDCDLGMESMIALATVLRQNKFMMSLNVGRSLPFSEQEETTVHMGLMLRVNNSLRELHLTKCSMRDFGVERLCDGLYENTALRYLNLSCNRITRDGAKKLARLLELNQTLEVLELGQNRLEDDGAIILSRALVNNFTLKCLSVVYNEIRGKGLVKLAECLEINSNLEKLYIWGNALELEACQAFKALFDRKRLEQDNTDVTYFEADGQVFLSQLNHGPRVHYYYTPLFGAEAKVSQKSLLDNIYASPVEPRA